MCRSTVFSLVSHTHAFLSHPSCRTYKQRVFEGLSHSTILCRARLSHPCAKSFVAPKNRTCCTLCRTVMEQPKVDGEINQVKKVNYDPSFSPPIYFLIRYPLHFQRWHPFCQVTIVRSESGWSQFGHAGQDRKISLIQHTLKRLVVYNVILILVFR